MVNEQSPEGQDEGLRAIEAALLSARWPNGDRLDGVTKRTAEMMAAAVLPLLTAERERERLTDYGKGYAAGQADAEAERDEARERAERLARVQVQPAALAPIYAAANKAEAAVAAIQAGLDDLLRDLRAMEDARAALSATDPGSSDE